MIPETPPSPSTPPASPPDTCDAECQAAIAANLNAAGASGDAVGVATPALTASTQAAQAKPGWWGSLVEMGNKFSDDDGMTQAAALAFYTGIALAPLLTVIVWGAQFFVRDDQEAVERVLGIATSVIGAQAAAPIGQLLSPATEQARSGMTITGIASIVFLAFTASGVFAQLQSSLNLIWNVKSNPKTNGIIDLIRKRLFSFGMLFTLLFLLLVSMMVSVGIEAVFSGKRETQQVAAAIAPPEMTAAIAAAPTPEAAVAALAEQSQETAYAASTQIATTQAAAQQQETRWILRIANLAVTFVVATGIFALLFAYLPDARVPWRDTLMGAALTSALFIAGRYAMGLYLGRGSYETSYGAAVGSFVALLVWVYYTSVIIFFGTVATSVFARRRGHDPRPERHAVRVLRSEKILASGDGSKPQEG